MNREVKRVPIMKAALPQLMRVAAYARVSSAKDAMRHSLSAQVSYYSDLIQQHPGWAYAGVYADEAKTGTKDSRENFVRLIDDCRAGRIDAIITKSISRFARNTVTLLETVRELKALGIDVYFEEQNIHTLSADGELLLTRNGASGRISRKAGRGMGPCWAIATGTASSLLSRMRQRSFGASFGNTMPGKVLKPSPTG